MKYSFLLILAIIFFWGLWGFFSKIAAQKIGTQVGLWNGLAFVTVILGYLFITKQLPPKSDPMGIFFALLSGIAISIGSIIFYILLKEKPAGFLVAATALYPLVIILLSILFLKESITFIRIVGFVFALIALFLFSL